MNSRAFSCFLESGVAARRLLFPAAFRTALAWRHCAAMMEESDLSNPGNESPSREGARPRIISSDELLQGRPEVWIEHGGEMYRLRLTSTGKLVLTK
jgi:hemin uptake protein HemP